MWTLEHDKRIDLRREILPHRIGARDVSAQCSERCRFRIDLEWNVVGIESAGGQHDERTKGVVTNQIVQDFDARFRKMIGDVH